MGFFSSPTNIGLVVILLILLVIGPIVAITGILTLGFGWIIYLVLLMTSSIWLGVRVINHIKRPSIEEKITKESTKYVIKKTGEDLGKTASKEIGKRIEEKKKK